ncbi:mucin-13b [Centropristis striata]|uniref:mucin-13b n=1 Tax=Centropristis striata TaxID=184440 RepID=UPI0027E019BD|nr:mucin-13b [Centropristis striata]
MAREFKQLFVLVWLLAACLATTTAVSPTTADPATTTEAPTTTADQTTTAEVPTTTTAATTTAESPSTTTTADPITTTEVPTTTTADSTATTETAQTTTAGPTTTKAPATTELPDPCDAMPCKDGSTCVRHADQEFVCWCLTGETYNKETESCDSAKVFPGQLDLPAIVYVDAMANPTSDEFKDTSKKIISVLDKEYKSTTGYSESKVLKITKGPVPKVGSRSEPGVIAETEIIFKNDAKVTEKEFSDIMDTKVICKSGCGLSGSFEEGDLCDTACNKASTKCDSKAGTFNCSCLDGYIKSKFSDRECIACPSGEKVNAETNDCVPCSFGRSGFNCEETWELALVIVGSVFGGLLLIAIILLPILALKSPKKSSKKDKKDKKADIGNALVSQLPAKKTFVNTSFANSQAATGNGQANGLSAYANAGVPRIPRASTNNSWNSRTNLEMTPSNSRQNLISAGRRFDDHEDMNRFGRPQSSLYAQTQPQTNPYAQSRPQTNPYAQSRPQTNPYAQSRPQTNPYAQSKGHNNPYFMYDDERLN